MRICHLHVGMPKTGSSSIQAAYNGYSDERVTYADLGRPNHTVPLTAALSQSPEKFYVFRRAELSAEEITQRVLRHRNAFLNALNGNKDIIFSAEGIVDHLFPHEISALFAQLNMSFDAVKVLIYVRPLASLAASQFQQRLKMGQPAFNLPAPNYQRRFEPFLTHANSENVTFVRFSRDDLIDHDVVRDFAARIGIAPPDGPAVQVNETLSAEALGAVYAFNRYIGHQMNPRDRSKMMHGLLDHLRGKPGTRFALHPDLITAHIENHRKDLDWAKETCGFDVDGDVIVAPDAVATEADLLAFALKP